MNQFIVLTRENLAELESRTKKPTKNGLLANFQKLVREDGKFDQHWLNQIKNRFLLTKIGPYCLDHEISAQDLVSALKKMNFDDFFEEHRGEKNRHNIWYDFKPAIEASIVTIFETLLPAKKARFPHHEPLPVKGEKELYQLFFEQLSLDLQLTPFTVKDYMFQEIPSFSGTVKKLLPLINNWEQKKQSFDLDGCKQLFASVSELLNGTKEPNVFEDMKRTGVTTQFYQRQLNGISSLQHQINQSKNLLEENWVDLAQSSNMQNK